MRAKLRSMRWLISLGWSFLPASGSMAQAMYLRSTHQTIVFADAVVNDQLISGSPSANLALDVRSRKQISSDENRHRFSYVRFGDIAEYLFPLVIQIDDYRRFSDLWSWRVSEFEVGAIEDIFSVSRWYPCFPILDEDIFEHIDRCCIAWKVLALFLV